MDQINAKINVTVSQLTKQHLLKTRMHIIMRITVSHSHVFAEDSMHMFIVDHAMDINDDRTGGGDSLAIS